MRYLYHTVLVDPRTVESDDCENSNANCIPSRLSRSSGVRARSASSSIVALYSRYSRLQPGRPVQGILRRHGPRLTAHSAGSAYQCGTVQFLRPSSPRCSNLAHHTTEAAKTGIKHRPPCPSLVLYSHSKQERTTLSQHEVRPPLPLLRHLCTDEHRHRRNCARCR